MRKLSAALLSTTALLTVSVASPAAAAPPEGVACNHGTMTAHDRVPHETRGNMVAHSRIPCGHH